MNKKLVVLVSLLLVMVLPLAAGCSGNYSDAEAMKAIKDYIAKYLEDMEEEEVVEGDMLEDGVTLLLTHPAGRSPKVLRRVERVTRAFERQSLPFTNTAAPCAAFEC